MSCRGRRDNRESRRGSCVDRELTIEKRVRVVRKADRLKTDEREPSRIKREVSEPNRDRRNDNAV